MGNGGGNGGGSIGDAAADPASAGLGGIGLGGIGVGGIGDAFAGTAAGEAELGYGIAGGMGAEGYAGSAAGEGPGMGDEGGYGQMDQHRDFTGKTGMTAPDAAKEKTPSPAQPERGRRAITKTLFTSPLGLPGEPSVMRKTLMAKNLREDLG